MVNSVVYDTQHFHKKKLFLTQENEGIDGNDKKSKL